MPTPDTTKPKTSIFISYAREDSAIAYRLEVALLALGFAVLIDKTGIAPGEDWKERIEGMIRGADVVVFILSPDSVGSPVCKWEIERTEELNKRLLPIKWRSVDGLALPPGLSRPNWLDFSEAGRLGPHGKQAFDGSFVTLLKGIETDIDWIRQGTELIARTERWKDAGRPADQFLLAGIEISHAQQWVSRRPDKERIPDDFHAFLKASLAKEERDREELNARERRISQEKQRLVAELARRAREAHRHESAMRLALAGEPTEDELARGIIPEPSRRAQLAAAAQAALCEVSLSGHSGPVSRAAFSADGTRVVTASWDKTARVWDATSGTQLLRLDHDDRVNNAFFSPNGAQVVTSAGGTYSVAFKPDGKRDATFSTRTTWLWDAATGTELGRFPDGVASVKFSADGMRVVTISKDGKARVWDSTRGAEPVYLNHDAAVRCHAFSADGMRIVTASEDKTVRVWDAASGADLVCLVHDHKVSNAAFSRDGARIVTVSWDQYARIWNAARGSKPIFIDHFGVEGATFSPDGARVVTVSVDRTARVWDVATGIELARFGHSDGIVSAEFSHDGARVLTASSDRTARVWDAGSGAELAHFTHDGSLNSATFSADGTRVVTASADKMARVWNATGHGEIVRLCPNSPVNGAAFSSYDVDSKLVATTSFNRVAQIWDATSGAELARFKHDSEPTSPTFLAGSLATVVRNTVQVWEWVLGTGLVRLGGDGIIGAASHGFEWVVTTSGNQMQIWEVYSGAELARVPCNGKSAGLSTDGTRAVVASWDKTAQILDLRSGAELARLRGHENWMNSAAFSGDNLRVVTASFDRTARVWDSGTGAQLAVLNHEYPVKSASFNFGGARVVTVSWDDDLARIWDAASGAELTQLSHNGHVTSAMFSWDGARVLTASDDDCFARIWDVTWVSGLTDELLVRAVARERLTGMSRLTEDELRILRPILGEVDPDVTSRWLSPSTDDEEIEETLAQWRRHREMALALAKTDWAARAEQIRADLAARRAADAARRK